MTEAAMHLRSLENRLALTLKETRFWLDWAGEQADAPALTVAIGDVQAALSAALAVARHVAALKGEEQS